MRFGRNCRNIGKCCTVVLLTVLLMGFTLPVEAFGSSITTTVSAALTELFQGPVTVDSAELQGLGRVVVIGIKVYDPIDHAHPVLTVDRLAFRYSILGLMLNLNNVGKAITAIDIVQPVITIKKEDRGWNVSRLVNFSGSDGTSAPREFSLAVVNGKFVFEGLDIGVERLPVTLSGAVEVDSTGASFKDVSVGVFEAAMTGSGAVENGEISIRVKSNELDFRKLTEHFPQFEELVVNGFAALDAKVTGSLSDPLVKGSVSLRSGLLETPLLADCAYSIDTMKADFSYQSGRLHVDTMSLRQGDGQVLLAGDIGLDGFMNVTANMTGFDSARNIPKLKDLGIKGKVDFAGSITGHLREPVLAGKLSARSGLFLGRNFDKVSGNIRLTPKEIALNGVEIVQGKDTYTLAGTVGLRGIRLVDLNMVTEAGEISEVLLALGIDGPLAARMNGAMRFFGPTWRVEVAGDLLLTNGTFMGQSFDSTYAKFKVADDWVIVNDGEATYNGAIIRFSGSGARGATLQLDIAASGWYLKDMRLIDATSSPLAQAKNNERIAFVGQAYVNGTLAQPKARIEAVVTGSEGSFSNSRMDLRMVEPPPGKSVRNSGLIR